MGINLYDSPAQAKFINTYVPIQFEGLYKLAEKREQDYEQSEALLDELVKDYSYLNTLSTHDKKLWDDNVYAIVKSGMDDIKSPEDLMDPMKQAGIKRLSRKIKSNPLTHKLLANAINYKEFAKSSDKRWQGEEVRKAVNWRTDVDGDFIEQNIPWTDWSERSNYAVNDLKDSLIDRKNGYIYSGIQRKTIENRIRPEAKALASDPAAEMQMNIDFKNNAIPEKFLKKDSNGAIVGYDAEKYAEFRAVDAHLDKMRTNIEPDQVYLNSMRMAAQAANARRKAASREQGPVRSYTYDVRKKYEDSIRNRKLSAALSLLGGKSASVLGSAGKEYANISSSINALSTERAKIKAAGAHATKEQLARLSEVDSKLNELHMAVYSAENKLLDYFNYGVKKGAIKTNVGETGELDPAYVEAYYRHKYGEKKAKVSLGGSSEISAYDATHTSDMKLVSAANMKEVPLDKMKTLDKVVYAGMTKNKFSGIARYSPMSTSSNRYTGDAADIENLGYIYIPLKDAERSLGLNDGQIESMYENGGTTKIVGSVTKQGKNKIDNRYIKVPVKSNIGGSINSSDMTWAAVDKEMAAKGYSGPINEQSGSDYSQSYDDYDPEISTEY